MANNRLDHHQRSSRCDWELPYGSHVGTGERHALLRRALVAVPVVLALMMVFVASATASDETDSATPIATVGSETTGSSATGNESVTPTVSSTETVASSQPVSTSENEEESDSDESLTDELGSEGNVSSGDASSESGVLPAENTDQEAEASEDLPQLEVEVVVWACSVDPGVADPTTVAGCLPDADVSVSATQDGNPLGPLVTNGNGLVTFQVDQDAAFVANVDWDTIEPGYSPKGSGSVSGTVSEATSFTIVNVLNEVMGRVQIAAGECPTLGEAYTTFFVLGPMVRGANVACEPHANAVFSITGPGIDGALQAVTDEGGNWFGNLPVGTYTIENDAASTTFDVEADATTVLVTVDYYPGPKGTLTIERYECSEGEANDIQITVHYGGGGGPLNASCVPSSKSVEILDDESDVEPIMADLGDDGQTTVDIAAGTYIVRDNSGVEASVDVQNSGLTRAVINVITVSGSISAQLNFCPDPMSNFEDPSVATYWSDNCQPGSPGVSVSVLDANGNVVANADTGGEGSAYFQDLAPGTYQFANSGSSCAMFADGSDARSGFSLVAGQVVHVAAYGCAEPASPPDAGGDGDTGGTNGAPNSGNGNTSGLGSSGQHGMSVGNNASSNLSSSANAEGLYVSTLPSTGSGQQSAFGRHMWLMVLSTVALLLFGVWSIAMRRMVPAHSRSKRS